MRPQCKGATSCVLALVVIGCCGALKFAPLVVLTFYNCTDQVATSTFAGLAMVE